MRDETVPIESSLPGQEASLKIQQHTHLVVDDTNRQNTIKNIQKNKILGERSINRYILLLFLSSLY